MLTEPRPYGSFGPHVVFRLEGTLEKLWRASMPYIPQPDSLVGHLEGESDVTTWYKVESVKYEFDHDYEAAVGPGGTPVPYVANEEYFGVCVMVSEV